MGYQIIKQPNGKFAVWSTIVDNFIMFDADAKEIIDDRIEKCTQDIIKEVTQTILELNEGRKPYYQFAKSWKEARNIIKEVHGNLMLEELDNFIKNSRKETK